MNKAGDIHHEQVKVNDCSVHLATAGNKDHQPILFLHGYPETWRAFETVMDQLKDKYYVLAIDLPGVGNSDPIASSDKKHLAKFISAVIKALNVEKPVLAGHDVGGMITYSFIKLFPGMLSKAIIMDTAVPGIEPWEEVKRNPHIWHFAFYAVPSLPEALATGKQRLLFDYFYDTISANKNAISNDRRKEYAEAYGKPSSLKTGFDWYRAFAQDEKDNAGQWPVETPVLYIRGDKEYGDIQKYIDGFKKGGLQNVKGELIAGCGHFSPEEQPGKVARLIDDFII